MSGINLAENIKTNLELSKRDKKYLNINKIYKELIKIHNEQKAKEWIHDVCFITKKFSHLLTQPFCLWDTETTGVNPDDEIIELGILSSNKTDYFQQLFKPLIPISKGAQNVHHISNDDVENENTISHYYNDIKNMFENFEIGVAYNGTFDHKMMKQTLFNHQLPDIKLPALYDPMLDMALWCGNWNKKHNSFKWLKLEGGHRAIDDCNELLNCIELIASLDIERLQHEYN